MAARRADDDATRGTPAATRQKRSAAVGASPQDVRAGAPAAIWNDARQLDPVSVAAPGLLPQHPTRKRRPAHEETPVLEMAQCGQLGDLILRRLIQNRFEARSAYGYLSED
jgi:hypothetical protein